MPQLSTGGKSLVQQSPFNTLIYLIVVISWKFRWSSLWRWADTATAPSLVLTRVRMSQNTMVMRSTILWLCRLITKGRNSQTQTTQTRTFRCRKKWEVSPFSKSMIYLRYLAILPFLLNPASQATMSFWAAHHPVSTNRHPLPESPSVTVNTKHSPNYHSAANSLNPPSVCIFLSNGTCTCVDVEDGNRTSSAHILKSIVETEECRLPPMAIDVFALWMSSPEIGNSENTKLPQKLP